MNSDLGKFRQVRASRGRFSVWFRPAGGLSSLYQL